MITKLGMEFVKESELYGPTGRALVAGAEALERYLAGLHGGRRALAANIRRTEEARNAFVSAAEKELESVSKKYPQVFYMGDVGGHEVYATKARLGEIPEKRLVQSLDHSHGIYQDLTPEGLHELYALGFQSDPSKLLKGVSYSSNAFDKRVQAYRKDNPRLSEKQLAKLLIDDWLRVKEPIVKNIERSKNTSSPISYNLYNQYKSEGVNDMFVSAPGIVTKSGHSTALLTTPVRDMNEFGDASEFTTLYKIYPEDIAKQQRSGRIVEPLKLMSE